MDRTAPAKNQSDVPTRRGAKRAASHDRIVAQAARLVRERGVEAATVNDVMDAAGLTRGGFYAHFEDKDAMVAEALDSAFAYGLENLVTSLEEEGDAWRARAAKRYLSQAHVERPGGGCAIPSVGADVSRSEKVVRRAFSRGVGSILDGITEKLGGPDGRAEAIAFLSTCVGAMILARATDDPKLTAEILAAARARASEPPGRPSARRARHA